MAALDIIYHFYPEDTPLRRLLILHSTQVRDKALQIAHSPACQHLSICLEQVADGAMLHDIGIAWCHAPSIFCEGEEDYIAHGVIGARLLRELAGSQDPAIRNLTQGIDLEPLARICERHTGTGLTAEDIVRQQLPIPVKDYLPETIEEKLVCLADKFYSKSRTEGEKPLEHIRRSMMKFGTDSVGRFEQLCALFSVK